MRIRVVAAFVPLLVIAVFLLAAARPAHSYLSSLTSNAARIHWPTLPVSWNLNPNISGSHVTGSRSVGQVVQAAFTTWTGAPNTAVSAVQGANSSVTSESSSPSNINLVCFICTSPSGFTDASTLAITFFTFDDTTGNMSKADILFNPADAFTTDPASASDTVTDLQTVATHEIGHLFGLDHSAVVTSVMFPFSPVTRDTLAWDDVAGISNTYPGTQTVPVGSLSGTVRFGSGAGVFGAHVFADSTTTASGYGGNVRKSPIGTLTNVTGQYTITGLPVDSYTITAEPLDGPVSNSDVSGYATALKQSAVQTNFTTRQH